MGPETLDQNLSRCLPAGSAMCGQIHCLLDTLSTTSLGSRTSTLIRFTCDVRNLSADKLQRSPEAGAWLFCLHCPKRLLASWQELLELPSCRHVSRRSLILPLCLLQPYTSRHTTQSRGHSPRACKLSAVPSSCSRSSRNSSSLTAVSGFEVAAGCVRSDSISCHEPDLIRGFGFKLTGAGAFWRRSSSDLRWVTVGRLPARAAGATRCGFSSLASTSTSKCTLITKQGGRTVRSVRHRLRHLEALVQHCRRVSSSRHSWHLPR